MAILESLRGSSPLTPLAILATALLHPAAGVQDVAVMEGPVVDALRQDCFSLTSSLLRDTFPDSFGPISSSDAQETARGNVVARGTEWCMDAFAANVSAHCTPLDAGSMDCIVRNQVSTAHESPSYSTIPACGKSMQALETAMLGFLDHANQRTLSNGDRPFSNGNNVALDPFLDAVAGYCAANAYD